MGTRNTHRPAERYPRLEGTTDVPTDTLLGQIGIVVAADKMASTFNRCIDLIRNNTEMTAEEVEDVRAQTISLGNEGPATHNHGGR